MKHKDHKKKRNNRVGTLSFSRLHMLLVVAVTAFVGGAYVISQSFAATPSGTTQVQVRAFDASNGVQIALGSPAGFGVHAIDGLGRTVAQSNLCPISARNGVVVLDSCPVFSSNGSRFNYVAYTAMLAGYNTTNSLAVPAVSGGTTYLNVYFTKPAPAPQPQAPAPQTSQAPAPQTSQAPAPQPQAPAPQPQAPAPQPSRKVTSTRTVARTQPSATNNSDTSPPSVPGSLTATEVSGGVIDLSWTPSTDNKTVTSYTIERSLDGQNWTTLSESVTIATYSDSSTTFNTKYTYRVSAKDEAGNGSDYAIVDIATSAFEANALASQETTIESEDKNVSVKIPEGALPEDASCKIDLARDITVPEDQSLLAGVYNFTCKKRDGSTIDKYNKPLEFTVKAEAVDKAQLAFQDGDQWQDSGEQYNGDVKGYTFSTDQPKNFAILAGDKKGTNWILLIFGIFLLLLAIFGIILWIIRRRQNRQELAGGYGLDYFDNYMQSADQQSPQSPQYSDSQSIPSAPSPETNNNIFAPTPATTQDPQPQQAVPEIKKMHEKPQADTSATLPQAEVPQSQDEDYASKQYPDQPYR